MSELVALRRRLHQIPEVGLLLPETQAVVLAELAGLPLELTRGRELSSITAVLRGMKPAVGPRRVVLLRADMDALPIEEATGLDYAATNGAMHACGHDLHMAMLIGAARELCARRAELAGDVVFMFQPGEESVDGASHMLAEGVLDAAGTRPCAAYAIHVWAGMESHGVFTTKPGTTMASHDVVRVRLVGQGGHGSAPHRAADPVPALAELITATHTMVTRQFDAFDPVVVTVGKIAAGEACNVIPESAELEASVRTFSPETRERAIERISRLAHGIAAAHGLVAEVANTQSYPPTVNDAAEADFVADTICDVLGPERHRRWENSLTSSEDFSRVLQEIPGCFFGLSACPPELDPATAPFNHSAHALFDDAVLADGVAVFTELTLRKLR
ncbi:M20 family metallopeptidase [Tessaracoccus sp. OH4464_COT-324]|uniref:M20 metallopeptidase family protein n=1 Tax=Tessaracoccus sp. OH4464_COT-324 TaxID=2491059 RepID=UPI000F6357D7|nr:M20 family metallopeptidase [Tessaracoccus sp. OH4464_COT-324]RRD47153.1 amidohydrolase [Tessaracoccus sp. OH4464_COT-324]